MAKFISDEEMAKLESAQPKKFISDAEMADLESKSQPSASVTDLIRPIQQGASLGFADEIGALGAKAGQALGSGIRSLVTGDSAPIQSYDQLLQEQRSADKAVNETYPIASTVAEIAGGGVLPVSSIGGIAAQGAAYGLGKSEADNLGGMAKDAALGGAIAGGTGAALKALPAIGSAIVDNPISNKVKDWIANSRLGKTFAGGKNVQKYTDPAQQTDLANAITYALDDKMSTATTAHSNTRQGFTDAFGSIPVNTKDVAATIQQRIGRFGPDLEMGGQTFGAMTPKENQALAEYMNVLDSDLNAQQLYKVWDKLKQEVDFNAKEGASTAYNQQLESMMGGIKEKLHALSPELTTADESIAQLMTDAGLLRSARKDSTAESFLAGLNGRNKGNTREALDRTIGDNADLMKRIEDFQTYQSWNKQGGFGSDSGLKNVGNVALGSMLGGTVGAAAASVLGQSATQRALVSAAGEAFHKATGIAAPIFDKMAPKYQAIMQEAAKRGGNAAAVTYFLLQSSDPEFQAQIKEESSK